MNSVNSQSINRIADRWAEIMWAISWQFCILGLAVLVIHWSLRRATPNWRYWLWQILAIKLLLMPFWTAAAPWLGSKPSPESALSVPAAGSTATKSAVASQASPNSNSPLVVSATSRVEEPDRTVPELSGPMVPLRGMQPISADAKSQSHVAGVRPRQSRDQLIVVAPDARDVSPNIKAVAGRVPVPGAAVNSTVSWRAWLMLAWLLGVSWYVLRITWQGAALSRRLRETQPAESALLQAVCDAAAQLGLKRIPEVRILDAEISPFVCGLWRARLIMPLAVSTTFTPEQLNLVLLHELAHVSRRDLFWGWISEIGRVLFFFHPLVHVVCNQIRFERELACDQLAMLSSGRDAATYADTLVRVVGQGSYSGPSRLAIADHRPA